ncbi:uncharacterized protein LAJ45_02253 [Morchella importuna]|uniref:uncharacterized protein n=1 Tax=Morchella importuna TaxID=1174673 RepID=UPI001E8DCEE7|nr:uncharacterized protein LAJ45_02253 [Morchella importuna]KAH8153440.1 hypothetical protein LAJ45_02253 [Morchella importuna]
MLLVRIDAARDYRSLSESNGTWEGAKQGAAAKSRSMEAKKEGRTEGSDLRIVEHPATLCIASCRTSRVPGIAPHPYLGVEKCI